MILAEIWCEIDYDGNGIAEFEEQSITCHTYEELDYFLKLFVAKHETKGYITDYGYEIIDIRKEC